MSHLYLDIILIVFLSFLFINSLFQLKKVDKKSESIIDKSEQKADDRLNSVLEREEKYKIEAVERMKQSLELQRQQVALLNEIKEILKSK